MATLNEDNFHPDDPTVDLWRRLLRMKPPAYKARTPAERRKAAISVQNYYLAHRHPRQGIQPGSEPVE